MFPRSIELPGADGIRLHALVWSEDGTLLLFVHGFGNDAHVWDEIAPSVLPHYRTVALTLRGHGDSGRGAEPGLRPDTLVRDLEAAVEALGAERLVLVGHSLGGRVCMQFAGRNPGKLAGLVLVDVGPELDGRGTTRIRSETRSQGEAQGRGFTSPAEYLRVLERQYPAARPDTLARLAEHWLRRRDDGRYELKLDLRRLRASAEAAQEREARSEPQASEGGPPPADRSDGDGAGQEPPPDLWDCLRRTPCPTLVVRGAASDVLSQEIAERMVEDALPKGRLHVIPRASHSVMLDNPAAFTSALCSFVLG
jgi:pimeloyl-ACP methyl ester carboxylesterase